ncbi:MAG TPA: HD domain-containing protein [Terriglobales bacterium]|nr:HD domain-containing protein [Terriglobales bacterium]
MDRAAALELLHEYTQSPSLRKHALAVEACMRAYARRFGEDEERWAVTGLLHDFDYERWPDPPDHPQKGNEILTQLGWPEDIRRAILSHADYMNVARVTPMEKSLFACDELAGFLTACALVKPNKSLNEVEVASVKKKLKDKAFARSVHREDIYAGAEQLGVSLDEHIQVCLDAMRAAAPALGLAGAAGV